MSVGDLFFFFFMFTALQPVLRQRMLEAMRARKIAQIERRAELARHPAGAPPGDHAPARFPGHALHRHQRFRGRVARNSNDG